jgi:maltooligosyltrehalose trehalohydrolase
MSFAHTMSFGAQLQPDGNTRFRLWAPAERAVSLVLEDAGEVTPMSALPGGWFEHTTSRAPAGARYRFQLADGMRVPDPASRGQSGDVHGSSVVIDPHAYRWRQAGWQGRPWHEAVIAEVHIGTFSADGTFTGALDRLRPLADLGVTTIELMPIADFPGTRNWGYDGVLPFSPDERYGTPDDLKELIDAAHACGLMVLLDVVYNHFGPDGNYLNRYAAPFFTEKRHTPWGPAIDFSRRPVRDFFIDNALYWIEEYRFDGLRMDAVHEIVDETSPHFLEEIATQVRSTVGHDRHVHLVLENDRNSAALLERTREGKPRYHTAQWNDDFHHALHVALTGETSGYYADYAADTIERVGRILAEGFAYQGEFSPYRNTPRGEASGALPPVAFVNFLQNHDQIGNRAFGERLTTLASPDALRAASAILLLAPSIPLLFMGEEYGATDPFYFFVDVHGDLATAVREGRRKEFARFADFADPESRERIPDPGAVQTYTRSIAAGPAEDDGQQHGWLVHHRELLAIRHREIVPRLQGMAGRSGAYEVQEAALVVRWRLADESVLHLTARLSPDSYPESISPAGVRLLWTTHPRRTDGVPGWFVAWGIDES